ncbi:MAG: hypothetical protein JXA51_03555 [Dehalococcoidales bacterium]|nr:hypothetical protein [Dehalococcoidales bacterium]
MAVKNKNLYLYLALVCFVGIILVFVFDGYMGIYDTLVVKSGEDEQRIEETNWERDYWSAAVGWGEKAYFYYEVDNRRFSAYTEDVEVSVWHSLEKVADIPVPSLSIGAFDKQQVEWVMDFSELVPADASSEQGYEFTLYINRGEIERKFVVHVRPGEYPVKAVPAPVPPR